MNVLKISLTAFVLLLACNFILAAENDAAEEVALDESVTAEDLDIEEPTLLPDSPFYLFKNWGREVQAFFTFDPVKKAELRQRFANEKLMELNRLVAGNRNSNIIRQATENYQEEVDSAKRAVERIRENAEDNEEVGKFLDKFIQHQALHQRILQKLETQVPEDAFEKIAEARERHLERFGEVMDKLETNKEKLQERLENKLQEIKGSEFKEFMNIKVLQQLEERVPEAIKEAIQNVRTNTLIRLKTKLEAMSTEQIERFKVYTETVEGQAEEQLEILEDLEKEVSAKPLLKQKLIETRDRVLEKIERPAACITLWNPVCGEDGKTYSNSCFAEIAEVEIDYRGACLSSGESNQQIQQMQQIQQQIQKQIKSSVK